MGEHLIQKRYENHYGLDLKSTDLTRDTRYASAMLNAQYRKSGGIEKRKGFHTYGADTGQGGLGLHTYNRTNPTTGAITPFAVSVGKVPSLLNYSTLTVTYTGPNAPCQFNLFFDPVSGAYRCQIYENVANALDMSLGLGIDEASPVTVGQLRTAINALPNYSATVTGSTSTPAAFLQSVRAHDLTPSSGSPVSTKASYYTALNTTVTSPFQGAWNNRNNADFENVSAVQLNNCLYLSSGFDPVQKYDGQTLYNAGLPGVAPLTVTATGTGLTGYYNWRAQYSQIDAVGQVAEGNLTTSFTVTSFTNQAGSLVVSNIQAGSGFNTNCALVNGNQTGVTTIAVTASPHTMKVGDTAYFLDRSTATYVTRAVTATTPTTVTIAGNAVNVNTGDVMSNNLRIVLWRTKNLGSISNAPTVWYEVVELPNNSFAATQTYVDTMVDNSLGAQLLTPINDRSIPPQGKYISKFNNRLVVSGIPTEPLNVWLSDLEDSPEYFPNDGSTSFMVQSVNGDVVTGLGESNNVLAVFKGRSIHVATSLSDGSIGKVECITQNIGCSAHATIKEVRGALVWLYDRGPYRMLAGQLPQPLGQISDPSTGQVYGRLEPAFDQRGVPANQAFITKKAVAVNYELGDKYILFLPAESTDGLGESYANQFSVIYAYDYSRDAWLQWDTLNMEGGAAVLGDDLIWQERRLSSLSGTVSSYLYRQHSLNDAWDYEDNSAAISFDYAPQWETMGEPSVYKRFLRMKTFSLEGTPNSAFSITAAVNVNFIPDVARSTFSFSLGSGGYGNAAYGVAPYGDPSESAPVHKLGPGRYKALRPRFTDSSHQQNTIISGWEIEVVTPFRVELKQQ